MLDLFDIIKVQTNSDYSPEWLIFSTPDKRIGVFGATYSGDRTGLEVVNVPYFKSLIEEVIDENLGHVFLQPNDRKTWRAFEKILYAAIRDKINDPKNTEYHGTEATWGVHVEPTIKEIDQKKLTGYVSFCFRELRMVYPFEIAPGEVFMSKPVVTVTELTNEFPKEK